MTPYEIGQLVIQVVAVMALLVTLYVYYRQLRTMGAQLHAVRDASYAQNILALTNFLQAPEVRAAREVVRGQLTGVASCNPAQPRRVPCSWISSPQGGLGLTVLVLPVSRRATATALSIDAILSAPVC